MTKDLIESPEIIFPRKVVGDMHDCQAVELVGYWDGSQSAFCAAIYVRWLQPDQSWTTQLLTAKSRVTPCSGLTTPRSELSGLVMLCRMMDTVLEAVAFKVDRITLIGDSSCTTASYDNTSSVLAPYFANRVQECHERIA